MRDAVRTDPVETWLEPKRSGGYRTMVRLSERDDASWRSVADRVVSMVERALGPEVLASRSASTARWRPEPFGRAYGRMRSLATRLAIRSEALLRTDVRDCYGSISPSVVHGSLRRLGVGHDDAATAADLVEGWGSAGCRGLPIGPTPSALVANAVLATIDEALRPLRFLRWADDLLVAVDDPGRIEETIDRVDTALDRAGLRRAVHKTAVTAPGGNAWLGLSLVPETLGPS